MPDDATTAAPPPELLGLTPAVARARVGEWVAAKGLPGYRAGQIERRLWVAPVAVWADATELPAAVREMLDAELPLSRLAVDTERLSSDGTRKFLWRL
ncbi:MAG: hypothetical protein ABI637_01140, partial [Gemmatimonadota bacterium]